MGRKTKLTPELQQKIVEVLAAGNYIEAACDYVGISHTAFFEWLNRGERGWQIDIDGGFVAFAEAIKRARSQAEVGSVTRIRRAASGELRVKRKTTTKADGTTVDEEWFQPPQWTADAWFLERSYPQRWGRRVVEHQGSKENPVEVRVKGYFGFNPDEWDNDDPK
jgi:hypothetical protein